MHRSWIAGIPFWIAAGLALANETRPLDLGGGVTLDVIRLEAGTFTEGSPTTEEGRGDDEAARTVTLTEPFFIGKTAVTVAQWQRFALATGYRTEAESGNSGGFGWDGKALVQQKQFTWKNPGFSQSPGDPVCLITFPDAEKFCGWLQGKMGSKVTLPTEAQWEYACRAGNVAAWHDGTETLAAAGGREALAWHKTNAGNGTRAANSITANSWGLHIGGNVAEWCQDWYAPYPAGPTTDPLQTNQNLSDKPRRVLRGGSWNRDLRNTRSAARFRADPRSRNADTGFRVVMSVEPLAKAAVTTLPSTSIPVIPLRSEETYPVVASRSDGFSFGSLVCPLIGLGAVVAIVIAIVKAANRRSSLPPGVPRNPNSYLPPTPPQQQGQTIRMADDGFWLNTDFAAGTALDVIYRLVNGGEQRSRIIYQPGPGGHFVFTGSRPLSASFSHVPSMAAGMMSGSSYSPHYGHQTTTPLYGNDFQRSDPPDNPAAY